MTKKKTKSRKQRLETFRRYRANKNAGRAHVGYLADLHLLQDVFLHLGILQPQIEDYSEAEIKRTFTAYIEDWEAGWGDVFEYGALARNRVRLVATSSLTVDAFVNRATCSDRDFSDRLYLSAWDTNAYLSLPA